MASDKVTQRSMQFLILSMPFNQICGILASSRVVSVDLKKAFDTFDHGIMLQKLAHCGFRGLINDWFRLQVTVVGNRSSSKSFISCWVPQGSVLGPLFFLLYVNDIYCSSKKLKFYLFADDTNILHSHKDVKTLEKEMKVELHNVYQWLVSNKLTLNLNLTFNKNAYLFVLQYTLMIAKQTH